MPRQNLPLSHQCPKTYRKSEKMFKEILKKFLRKFLRKSEKYFYQEHVGNVITIQFFYFSKHDSPFNFGSANSDYKRQWFEQSSSFDATNHMPRQNPQKKSLHATVWKVFLPFSSLYCFYFFLNFLNHVKRINDILIHTRLYTRAG